eukprot:scaffold549_cov174-Ochromonas_danica.AAC.6
MESCGGCDSNNSNSNSGSHCQQQSTVAVAVAVGGSAAASNTSSSSSSTTTTAAAPDPNAYQIHGYTVLFPEGRKPFAAQLSVISKVLHALKEGKNALLESPTGTGKTLAILSSTLAYQASLQAQAEATTSNKPLDSLHTLDKEIDAALFEKTPMKKVDKGPVIPKVFYCSRTHSQLKQIVEEFRRCHPAYSKQPKMCILGSRSHLCINDKALQWHAEGKPLDEVCQSLRDAHACEFIRKMKFADRTAHALRRMGVWDIEDAVEQGRECGGCPYYATRVIFEEARYILAPYNYLLDPSIRKALKIDLSGAIVVFDEAHNIEDTAREGASIDVLPNVFTLCIYELEKLLTEDCSYIYINGIIEFIKQLGKWVQEMGETLFHASSSLKASTPSDRSTLHRSKGNGGHNYTQASQSRYGSQQSTEDQECVWDGEEFLYIFSTRYQLTEASLAVYKELLLRLEEKQEEAKELRSSSKEEEGVRRETFVPIISTLTISFLRKLFSILDFMMRNNQSRATDFRIVIQKIENESNRSATTTKRKKSNTSNEIVEARTVYPVSFHIWCMTAAVVFEDLVGSARSIILTSGTLSPLDAFATELGTPFPIRLEARHVIDLGKQLFAATFDSFDGNSLLSTYQHQQSDGYLDVVGRALMMLIRLTPGGTLLFVPSYRLLQRLYERWSRIGLLEEIQKVVSCRIYFEQKANNDMSSVLQAYYEDLSLKGSKAAMVAVCRGKVSEGINFSDHYARTVAVLGIPFPALYDLQVHLKKDYQDRKFVAMMNNNNLATQASSPFTGARNADACFTPASTTKGSVGQSSNTYYTPFKTAAVPPPFSATATTETAPVPCINGKMWYNQQAFRAINQAIGRCIRHRNDFGSIILLDPRFYQDNVVQNLSRWMRDETRHFDRLEDCILPLQHFFQPFDSYSTLDHGVKEEKKVKQNLHRVKVQIEVEEEEEEETGTVDEQEESKKPEQRRISRGSIRDAFSKIIKQQRNESAQNASPSNSPYRPTVVSSPPKDQTRNNAEGEQDEENEAESQLSRLQVSPSNSTRTAVLHHLQLLWKDLFIRREESMVEGFGWMEQLENTLPPQLSALHELFSPGALVDLSTENLLPGGSVPWHFLIASMGANAATQPAQLRGNEILRFPWMNQSLFANSSAGSVISHAMDNKLIVVSEEWHKADQVVYQLVFLSISNEMGNMALCGSPLVNGNDLEEDCSDYELLAAKVIATTPVQASMLYKTFVKHSIIN